MKLEAVGRVSVSDLSLEVGGQVDNADGAEWALLGTDTTTNAEVLGDEGDFRRRLNFDTEASAAHDRARLLAFLPTFLQTPVSRHS